MESTKNENHNENLIWRNTPDESIIFQASNSKDTLINQSQDQ